MMIVKQPVVGTFNALSSEPLCAGWQPNQFTRACNGVLHGALDGGATRSLRLDGLGKSLAGAVLYLPLDE
jgi:hypothetical protein